MSQERPFLRLQSKDFLSGIAPSAHSTNGGLFYKAPGVTALVSPGVAESTDNGLLRPGPAGTDLTGSVVVDSIVCGVRDYPSSSVAQLYMMGSGGHIYQQQQAQVPTDLRTVASPANGITTYQVSKGGTKYLYYWMLTSIGRANLSTGTPASFDDAYISGTLQSTTMHPVHKYYDRVYYGNKDRLGVFTDVNGTFTNSLNILYFPSNMTVTDISDDGIYLYIAITDNNQFIGASVADTRILIWDTYSSSWQREYSIRDPWIQSLTRVGNVVYAQGQQGIYECTFGGVKRVLSRFTGGSPGGSNNFIGPGLAGAYLGGFLFSGASPSAFIGSLGKLADDVPSSFLQPIPLLATYIETNFGRNVITVATNTPKLYEFAFVDGGTGQTGVTAQTVYFNIPSRTTVNRIDVIFGEPLVSGDSMSMSIYKDEDTAATSFGSATFTADGATRRKVMTKAVVVEGQLSLLITFTAGLPKIRSIEVYGKAMTP